MTDQEALRILKKEYSDLPVGSVIHFTGWVITGGKMSWQRLASGWKKLEVRTSPDQ